MENSTIIIKGEIAFLLAFLIALLHFYKVEDYLKNEHYSQVVEEMINDENVNMINEINFKYYNLAKEFRNFVLRYNVSHDHIIESVLNDIIKRPIEYVLHKRQSECDSHSETDSHDDNNNNAIIDNNLQSMINNISQEKSISNNLKQLLINKLLKQSVINKILKDSKTNNNESLINDILNKKIINNNGQFNNDNEKTSNTFVETPMCIKSKRAVLNPRSNDNKSFQYSITL